MSHSCKEKYVTSISDYDFKSMCNFLFGSLFLSEAKMGSPVSSYITSKSFYLNSYNLWLVCMYIVVDSVL